MNEATAAQRFPRIGLGHDLQWLVELDGIAALREPGVFFSEGEIERCARSGDPRRSLGGVFSSKEALFKALPWQGDWFWTDAEVDKDRRGAPFFRFHGALGQAARENGWEVALTISHSGDYVSAVVLVVAGR